MMLLHRHHDVYTMTHSYFAASGTSTRSSTASGLERDPGVGSLAWWEGCQDLVDGLDISGLYEVRAKSRLAGSLTIVLLTVASQRDQMHSLGGGISA